MWGTWGRGWGEKLHLPGKEAVEAEEGRGGSQCLMHWGFGCRNI